MRKVNEIKKSVDSREVLAVEMLVDAFAVLALQVVEAVDLEHVRVGQEVVVLEEEERAASLRQSALQPDEAAHVLVVLAHVVEQTHHLLAVHCCLDRLVARVDRVSAEAIRSGGTITSSLSRGCAPCLSPQLTRCSATALASLGHYILPDPIPRVVRDT